MAPSSLTDRFWNRHSNPWSGWTRLLSTPVLMYALYRHNWRLLAGVVAFVAVNPVLFPEPGPEQEGDWMYRVVEAEQFWLERRESEGARDVLQYPNALNVANVPVFGYALYAAYRRKPVGTVLATAAAMALKLWFVNELVREHEMSLASDGSSVADRGRSHVD